ncbi:hypothetical protein PF007_g32627 [Phytophthora fragariae]|uniref:RxLR effector protein n=1 Tax=Phytophthora fragariae TaxID=53985 RepID=A0A6A3PDY4_9STRA|nr:hypothetical protein PF007_g32627 [Phytophthora fragariae]KAE9158228.1 hypothetical protein PF004_g31946 [Phytophthora fragariae]
MAWSVLSLVISLISLSMSLRSNSEVSICTKSTTTSIALLFTD